MNNRLEKIINISRDLEIPYGEVMKIYTKASMKLYRKYDNEVYGHPKVEREIFKLTKRYFKIYKNKTDILNTEK